MRRIGVFFFALFALSVIFAGCAEKEKEPKKTDEEATPSVSLLPQDAPVFSSDELFFPNTDKASATTAASVTTTTAVVTTSTSAVTTTTAASSPTTTTKPLPDKGGLELPDHNWN